MCPVTWRVYVLIYTSPLVWVNVTLSNIKLQFLVPFSNSLLVSSLNSFSISFIHTHTHTHTHTQREREKKSTVKIGWRQLMVRGQASGPGFLHKRTSKYCQCVFSIIFGGELCRLSFPRFDFSHKRLKELLASFFFFFSSTSILYFCSRYHINLTDQFVSVWLWFSFIYRLTLTILSQTKLYLVNKYKLGFFVQWHINLRGLLNTKGILLSRRTAVKLFNT